MGKRFLQIYASASKSTGAMYSGAFESLALLQTDFEFMVLLASS